MNRKISYWLVGVLLCGLACEAQAQLVAVDDSYSVPVAEPLVVEAPGVLDNDIYNGEPAVDGGATAELVSGPLYGTLECESDPGFELCPDGSFTYTPSMDFPGSTTFTYQAIVGADIVQATVTLTA